jgi:hypothetical protein
MNTVLEGVVGDSPSGITTTVFFANEESEHTKRTNNPAHSLIVLFAV